MKVFSVAQARADLANLLLKARREGVVIARYGKPVGLLVGLPPEARMEDVKRVAEVELLSKLKLRVDGAPTPAPRRTKR
jgi:prevent-host-death family protein